MQADVKSSIPYLTARGDTFDLTVQGGECILNVKDSSKSFPWTNFPYTLIPQPPHHCLGQPSDVIVIDQDDDDDAQYIDMQLQQQEEQNAIQFEQQLAIEQNNVAQDAEDHLEP